LNLTYLILLTLKLCCLLNGFPDGQNHYFFESRSVKISQNIKPYTEGRDEVMVDTQA